MDSMRLDRDQFDVYYNITEDAISFTNYEAVLPWLPDNLKIKLLDAVYREVLKILIPFNIIKYKNLDEVMRDAKARACSVQKWAY